jgi:asparagine synthase (glutamine-hydrolysing)
MSNEDGTIWIVFNGEIYNYQDIRKNLQKKHKFKSQTDTETIIHLYEEKGIDCLNDLDGMFAFALWDEKIGKILLARDKIGKKPLYYSVQGGRLIFASEIKSILKHPQIKAEMDREAFYHYLTFLVTPAPMTLFKDIKKIPAGHYLICYKSGDIGLFQYWDAVFSRGEEIFPEKYYIEKTKMLLEKSVAKRMMSDVPCGVFLSGGIDSSTNVALMSQLTSQPVETFSVRFDGQPGYDESGYARQIAKQFKTNHHEITIGENDLIDFIPKLVYCQDEPLADWVCFPLYFAAKLAKDNGVPVIQIGEGSDEIFFGYDGYLDYFKLYQKIWQPYLKVPQIIRKGVYYLLLSARFIEKKWGREDAIRRAAFNEPFFWSGVSFWETQKKRVLSGLARKNFQNLNSAEIVSGYLEKIKKQKPNSDFLEEMTYLEFKLRLPELILMRLDKMMMANSIEGRAPFLDCGLVEFAFGIPTEYKIKNNQTKYILKKAMEGIIPNDIIYRKKQGFSAPVKEWFSGKLGKVIEEGILDSKIINEDLFDYRRVKKLLEYQKRGKGNYTLPVWTIFNLCKWYDYWIAKENI